MHATLCLALKFAVARTDKAFKMLEIRQFSVLYMP